MGLMASGRLCEPVSEQGLPTGLPTAALPRGVRRGRAFALTVSGRICPGTPVRVERRQLYSAVPGGVSEAPSRMCCEVGRIHERRLAISAQSPPRAP
jgi:hypothetical protein